MKFFIKILLVFGIAFASFQNVNGQPVSWQKLYNGPFDGSDLGYDVCQTSDGNFVMAGSTKAPSTSMYVLKINHNGDTLWSKIISGSSQVSYIFTIVATNDGGCAFSGYSDRAFTIKLNNLGNIIWYKSNLRGNVQCYDLIETIDSGFIGCGRVIGEGGYVFKVDKNGNFIFEKLFPDEFRIFKSIEIAYNSGYIICGTLFGPPTGEIIKTYILRINETGDFLWDRSYFELLGLSGKVIKKVNSNYIISGGAEISISSKQTTPFDYSRISIQIDTTKYLSTKYLMKIDTSGNQIYFKDFSSLMTQYLGDLQIINNNRFLFIGSIDSIETTNGLLTISDSLGNIINERTYQSSKYLILESGLVTKNKDIVAIGTWGIWGLFNRDDIYSIKTDSLLIANPVVNVNNQNNYISNEFILYQNYPNPFNPNTNLEFQIPKSTIVSLKVYDLLGKEVATLVNERLNPGSYRYEFDGSNLSSGIYFYKLVSGDFTAVKRMVLVK